MALLFAVGAMNLVWVAALAAVVLIEKLFPHGVWIGRIGGLLLAAYRIGLLGHELRVADAVPSRPRAADRAQWRHPAARRRREAELVIVRAFSARRGLGQVTGRNIPS